MNKKDNNLATKADVQKIVSDTIEELAVTIKNSVDALNKSSGNSRGKSDES